MLLLFRGRILTSTLLLLVHDHLSHPLSGSPLLPQRLLNLIPHHARKIRFQQVELGLGHILSNLVSNVPQRIVVKLSSD